MPASLMRQHILKVIAATERHIGQSDRHISEQQERIVWMEANGCDAAHSKEVLQTFIAVRASHCSHRARLLRELADSGRRRLT